MNIWVLKNFLVNNQIRFIEVKNKQNEFLNKLSNIKVGKKTTEQKEVINNIEKFTTLEKKLFIFLETIFKCCLMPITMQNLNQLKKQDLKY